MSLFNASYFDPTGPPKRRAESKQTNTAGESKQPKRPRTDKARKKHRHVKSIGKPRFEFNLQDPNSLLAFLNKERELLLTPVEFEPFRDAMYTFIEKYNDSEGASKVRDYLTDERIRSALELYTDRFRLALVGAKHLAIYHAPDREAAITNMVNACLQIPYERCWGIEARDYDFSELENHRYVQLLKEALDHPFSADYDDIPDLFRLFYNASKQDIPLFGASESTGEGESKNAPLVHESGMLDPNVVQQVNDEPLPVPDIDFSTGAMAYKRAVEDILNERGEFQQTSARFKSTGPRVQNLLDNTDDFWTWWISTAYHLGELLLIPSDSLETVAHITTDAASYQQKQDIIIKNIENTTLTEHLEPDGFATILFNSNVTKDNVQNAEAARILKDTYGRAMSHVISAADQARTTSGVDQYNIYDNTVKNWDSVKQAFLEEHRQWRASGQTHNVTTQNAVAAIKDVRVVLSTLKKYAQITSAQRIFFFGSIVGIIAELLTSFRPQLRDIYKTLANVIGVGLSSAIMKWRNLLPTQIFVPSGGFGNIWNTFSRFFNAPILSAELVVFMGYQLAWFPLIATFLKVQGLVVLCKRVSTRPRGLPVMVKYTQSGAQGGEAVWKRCCRWCRSEFPIEHVVQCYEEKVNDTSMWYRNIIKCNNETDPANTEPLGDIKQAKEEIKKYSQITLPVASYIKRNGNIQMVIDRHGASGTYGPTTTSNMDKSCSVIDNFGGHAKFAPSRFDFKFKTGWSQTGAIFGMGAIMGVLGYAASSAMLPWWAASALNATVGFGSFGLTQYFDADPLSDIQGAHFKDVYVALRNQPNNIIVWNLVTGKIYKSSDKAKYIAEKKSQEKEVEDADMNPSQHDSYKDQIYEELKNKILHTIPVITGNTLKIKLKKYTRQPGTYNEIYL